MSFIAADAEVLDPSRSCIVMHSEGDRHEDACTPFWADGKRQRAWYLEEYPTVNDRVAVPPPGEARQLARSGAIIGSVQLPTVSAIRARALVLAFGIRPGRSRDRAGQRRFRV